jgi:GNAT superfamily N-acetyltransferase
MQVYETEDGFAVYAINGREVYIRDIYVKPERRRLGVAAEMADSIAALAKSQGAKVMTGTVCPTASNATDSLKVLLGYGMRLIPQEPRGGLIWFMKEI